MFFSLLLALTIVIYIFDNRKASKLTKLESGQQSGVVKISDRMEERHEVFYPKKYVSSPNLKIDMTIGLGARLKIIEQREDGFVFSASDIAYSRSDGAQVKWDAHGELATNNN